MNKHIEAPAKWRQNCSLEDYNMEPIQVPFFASELVSLFFSSYPSETKKIRRQVNWIEILLFHYNYSGHANCTPVPVHNAVWNQTETEILIKIRSNQTKINYFQFEVKIFFYLKVQPFNLFKNWIKPKLIANQPKLDNKSNSSLYLRGYLFEFQSTRVNIL